MLSPHSGRLGNIAVCLLLASVGTFLATEFSFVIAMGVALGWPVSDGNFWFSIQVAAIWGGFGALLLSIGTLGAETGSRFVFAMTGMILWSSISGLGFCLWIEVIASV